jgi:nucleotide-binding universal stress UspA family protein
VRVFAPADQTRRRVVRWASRHAARTDSCLQVLVDPEERCADHTSCGGVVGLLGQTVRDLASRVLTPLRSPSTSLVRDLEGAAAGARLLVVPQSLPQLPALVEMLSEPVVAVPDLPRPPDDARVVLALAPWSGPEVIGTAFETAAHYGVDLQVIQVMERAEDRDEAVRTCADELAAWRLVRPEVGVDLDVVDRDPVEALSRRIQDAQLVVTGRPARGRARELLAPSPASELLRTAPCPVLVVPSPGVPRPTWWARPGWGLMPWNAPWPGLGLEP